MLILPALKRTSPRSAIPCGGEDLFEWRGSWPRLQNNTSVRVLCQKQGDTVNAEGYTNNWWSKLRDQNGFISNIYIDHPAAQLPGVPLC